MDDNYKPVNENTVLVHNLRKGVDRLIKDVKMIMVTKPQKGGREFALAHTKLQEAKMWLGKVLEEMGSELPVQFRDEAPQTRPDSPQP